MPDPMWRQVSADLRQRIESGELGGDGQPLPSELELRDTYHASRNTVRDALKWLATCGLVVTRPGEGSFVRRTIDPFTTTLATGLGLSPLSANAAFTAEVAGQQRTPDISMPRVEIRRADGVVAAELRLVAGEAVVSRQQERSIDGTPWSLQTSFYPMRLAEQGAMRLIQVEDLAEGVLAYLADTLGITEARRRDRLTVRAPDPREAVLFRLPDDGSIAVIEITQTSHDGAGEPFRVTITSYPADRNQFVMTLARS
jgi:GntR family transcriptional regulator